jgi:hypothetical protein
MEMAVFQFKAATSVCPSPRQHWNRVPVEKKLRTSLPKESASYCDAVDSDEADDAER